NRPPVIHFHRLHQLVAGFWRRSNLAVSRPGPGFSADASESGKVPFSGGPKWLEINAGRRFRRNWNSRSSSNLSCRTSPPAPAVRHRSSASTKYSTTSHLQNSAVQAPEFLTEGAP